MEKQSDAFDYSRHVKAEILMYQQSRATPYELEYITSVKPCKGVIRISPLRGFHRVANPTNRALPYPDDYKAFSLNPTFVTVS